MWTTAELRLEEGKIGRDGAGRVLLSLTERREHQARCQNEPPSRLLIVQKQTVGLINRALAV